MLQVQKLPTSLLKSTLQNHTSLLLSTCSQFHLIHNATIPSNPKPQHEARSWNTLISGLARTHQPREALLHFIHMAHSSVRPDNFTYSSIIPCCNLRTGRQIHAQTVKVCSNSDTFVGTNLVKMYAEEGAIGDARKVFDGMAERDSAAWNVLVSCYSKLGMGALCVQLFRQMVRDGVRLDEFTFAIVLNEYATWLRVSEGMQLHSLIVRSGFCTDRFACNALLNLYSKGGFVNLATKLFGEMVEPDVVSWTAMIMGYVVSGCERDAFEAFYRMRVCGVEPNCFTFGSLIGSCASANVLVKGKQYHGLAVKYGLEFNTVVGSAIVDMYSKCGEMDDAMAHFQRLPNRDVVSWNGIICGLAQNGDATKALELFNEMAGLGRASVTPNHVTFVGVLTACSHGGLVSKGCSLFNEMVCRYSIEPLPEHYACLVDLLGRAGLLEEAESVVLALPFKPDVIIWSALLGACRRHGHIVMAKRILGQLSLEEPRNSSSYVLLANMHTADGEWNDAMDVREVMSSNGAVKVKGSSWIEIRGYQHSFTSGHAQHLQLNSIQEVLQSLRLMMFQDSYQCHWVD